jgi:putative sigma-54 modulation protein
MNIEYVGRSYDIDDHLRGFTEQKLGKLDKFLHEPAEIRVTLEVEKHRFIADVHIAHRFGVLQATEETTGDMHEAINQAVDKVEKQARRSKNTYEGKSRRAADRIDGHMWPVDILARDSVGAGSAPRIIRSTQLQIKPMSVDEAALHLEGAENDFVVFRDAVSDKVSVLYKRKDNNYGLIAPEL